MLSRKKLQPQPDSGSPRFIAALDALDLEALRSIPKTDLHNHGSLGMRHASLAKLSAMGAAPVEAPPSRFRDFSHFMDYTSSTRHLSYDRRWAPLLFDLAIQDAIADGVKALEMSFDLGMGRAYGKPEAYAAMVADLKARYAGQVSLKAEIGINKRLKVREVAGYLRDLIDSASFDGLDLYGFEAFPAFHLAWRGIYRYAAARGLKLKAHLGEFQGPLGIPAVAQGLGLDAIQHGVSLCRSRRALAWARSSGLIFHVCPASNVLLGAASSWEAHPLRLMLDAGLRLSLATDDLLVFNSSVSQQFLELKRRGLFSSSELDLLRRMGLEEAGLLGLEKA